MNNNVLEVKSFNKLVKSKYFPLIPQILNLIAVAFLITIGWSVSNEALRYTNMTSFLVWVLWWPAIVIAGFFAARSWCTICHIRLFSDLIDKFGLKLEMPPLLKKYGSTVTIFMALGMFIMHSTVISYQVNHYASLTSWYLVALMIYALIVALLFKKGTFCKSMCPLVGFLGPYSRLSPTELRSNNKATCKECKAKECVKSCSNQLYMGAIESNEGCMLCFECVKACPEDNIRFSFRPFFKDLWNVRNNSFASTIVVVLLLGIIFEEVGEEWEVVENTLLYIPTAVKNFFGIKGEIFGSYHWLESMWFNILFPTFLLSITAVASKIMAAKGRALEYFKSYTLGLIPLLFSLHAAKLLHKFNSKAALTSTVIKNPSGGNDSLEIVTTAQSAANYLILNEQSTGIFMIILVCVGIISSLFVNNKIAWNSFDMNRSQTIRSAVPYYVITSILGIVFLMTIYNWKFPVI